MAAMTTVPLLSGGESPTAAKLNTLFDVMDSKVTQTFSGKSFILGEMQKGGIILNDSGGANLYTLGKLMGKCFFLTTGTCHAAPIAPGWLTDGSGGTRPYDQSQFEDVAAALTPTSYDEVNKIANIDRVDSGEYDGLPQSQAVGFFEHSLQVHYVMHQGDSDTEPVPYYLREAAITGTYPLQPPPEKYLRYGLAEIIIESDDFDEQDTFLVTNFHDTALGYAVADGDYKIGKYGCYRLHNLQCYEVTVKFRNPKNPEDLGEDTDLSITVPPYGIALVRKGEDGVYAQESGRNYFFNFRGGLNFPEDGDLRFYWYLPASTIDEPGVITDTTVDYLQPRAANSMAANNLTNPSILFDWVKHYCDDHVHWAMFDSVSGWRTEWVPKWFRDLTATDADPDNAAFNTAKLTDPANPTGPKLDLFGDPSNPATPIGDLFYHKGSIDIIKRHKTLTDAGTGNPLIVRDQVFFRGFSTIVSDFAAKGLTVAWEQDDSGDDPDDPDTHFSLWITGADADYDYDLLPIGTNLLNGWPHGVSGDYQYPTLVELPCRISGEIMNFTALGDPTRFVTGGGFNPYASEFPFIAIKYVTDTAMGGGGETTETADYPELHDDGSSTTETATAGTTKKSRLNAQRFGADNPWQTWQDGHGIHQATVGELLTLQPLGFPDLGDAVEDQDNAATSFENVAIKLTWEGWVISFDARYIPDGSSYVGANSYWQSGRIFRDSYRVRLYFRGAGFPYNGISGGSDTGFFHPRYGRQIRAQEYYQSDEVGVSGADFDASAINSSESRIRRLHRVQPTLPLGGGGGFQGDIWLTNPNCRFWLIRFMDNFLLYLEEGQTDAGYFDVRARLLAGAHDNPEDLTTTSTTLSVMALLPEMYNAMASTVNSITKVRPLNAFCLRWVFPDWEDETGLTSKNYYLPGPGEGSGAPRASFMPVPIEEYLEVRRSTGGDEGVIIASDEEQLFTSLGLSFLTEADLPDIGPEVDGAPDPSPLNVCKIINLKKSTTFAPVGAGSITEDSPGSGTYTWRGDVDITQTVEDITEDVYDAMSTPDLDNSRGFAVFKGPNWDAGAIIDMKTAWTGYRWVTRSNIRDVFGQYGIPVCIYQMCVPLAFHFIDERTYEVALSQTTATASVEVPCSVSDTAPGNDVFATFQIPDVLDAFKYRSVYWFGPGVSAADYDDPEDIPTEQLAFWKWLPGSGGASDPANRRPMGLDTWWLDITAPHGSTNNRNFVTVLSDTAIGSASGGTINFTTSPLSGTIGGADFPGLALDGSWTFFALTWYHLDFMSELIGNAWTMVLTMGVGTEINLQKEHFWTATVAQSGDDGGDPPAPLSTISDWVQAHFGGIVPVYNVGEGIARTITVPLGEDRSCNYLTGPFYGYVLQSKEECWLELA